MKKKFRLTIASLALCTVSCLALAVATSIKPNKTQTVTAETNVAPISNTYTLADFKIDETAAIRRADPMGIRFPTTVSADVKTQIINKLGGDESKVQFGTLIIPTDFLGEEELTHNTPSVVVGTVSEWTTDTVFTVVLGGKGGADLGESYYNRPLSARSFARNTETGEVCYTVNTANRSIGYVAYKANADGDESTVVAEIADKTKKELVFNESVSIYNEEIAGTGLIVNKYDKQSTNVFTLKIGGIAVDVISEGATITYSTSNSGIISTENGEVKAVDKGVATVTANITYNGVNYTGSKTISTDTYVSSSEFKILVPANADTYETTAANKLQDILLEATGVELAIITESGNETTDGKYLSVGDTALAKANCAVNDLTKNTASRVKTVGESVFVRGVTKAATLYGVQQLLSDTVGYEYYLNNAYVVNEEKEVVIEDKDYVPQIDEVWQMGGSADQTIAEEHAAVAYTANLVPIGTTDAQDQGSERYKGAAHNSILFFNDGVDDNSLYTSSSKSYKKWYATNSSNYYLTGKSGLASLFSGAGKQELCYTAHGDSTVRSAMIEKLTTEMFRKMTTIEEFKAYNRVAFSHSDVQTWCTCSNCTNEGNPSDNMLHFILDVAANLKTKLANAGDARAETFKICTLFYNETNLYPKSIANYQSAVDNYMQHVEIWFAETRADYHVSLETETTWNTTAKSNFDQWTALANSKGADVLWWGYYTSAKTSFIPYDSIDALRANYALAYENGVDYMFNQMMQYTVNWSRLKQYLSSELRWNATPDDATWNGWIADYMKAAFGPGADAMTEYYDAWKSWAEVNKDSFNNGTGYSGSGIYKQLSDVCTTSNMTAETLQAWIASCDKAIAALDVNDDNYTLYYNNIVLEKMTPLYLIMHLHGYNYELEGDYDTKASYSVENSEYILPYAQDFLDAAALWNVYQDGELTSLENFKAALESQIAGITEYKESSKQTVVVGTSITLSSENIVTGEYDVTLINSAGMVTGTGSATSDGSVTITFASAPAVGPCNVELRSASKVITFNNVVLVTGTIGNYTQLKAITGKTNSGYYVLTNDITDASGTITLRAGSFKGVLDGNGYTVSNISVGASGLFKALEGAIIKNINFVNYTATGAAFGTTATNCTFENMSISFVSGGPAFATTETGCAYKNVTIYVASASAVSVPDGAKLVVGAETGKTFYISEGENEVWIRDENLVQGNYTIEVNGEISTGSVFATGRLKVAIPGVALGETIKVSCDNGTSAYVYNVMRVSKVVYAESGEALPTYNGDKTALGYYNSDVIQTLTVANGDGSTWDGGIWNNRVKIFASGSQDYITVDFVAENDFVDTIFQIWPTNGAGSFSKTGVFNDSADPTGATVSIVDEYGFAVNTVAAGKRYTLRVYDPGATGLALSVWGTNTIYFGNVTYGKGTPAEPLTPPNVTVGDNRVYSIYQGDETALGFEADTMVFLLENNTPDNIYGDGWGKRMIFGAPTTQDYDYITFEFVAKEDVEAADIFHVWGANGAPSIGTISTATGKGGDWAIILDKHGVGVTSIKAGEHYFANIKCAGLTNVQVGALDVNEIYVANVKFPNGDLPTAIQPLVYGLDNSAVPVYEGDKEAIGLADQELVFASTAGANTWNDNAIKFYTDSSKNCLEIDFALSNTLNSGNQFMIWTSAASGAAAFINNGNVTQNVIDVEILDADGNAVTEFAANTKYTFKIYHVGSTTVTIALVGETQQGTTVYYGDYSDTDDKVIALPENVVTYSTDGGHTGENLSRYTGDATAYGFGAEDYVFEATMTAAWDDRAIIAVDSANYDYMDVEFVVTSGAWYFNAWVVNANGMLDGSYLVAENASNATYGSGYAPHTPNTGANGGKTKIQVLDTNGNVVTGGRTLGTRYILRVYLDEESLTKVHLGQDNVTMLFANVTFGIVETITADSTNASAVTVYDGDETALGFAEGSRVYEYVGADSSKDKAVFSVDSANYDYVDVQLVIASGDGYFFAYALNGGNYLNGGASYVIDPSNIRLASGNAMDRTIQVFDANGNAVSTLMSTNTLYTLRIYINGADQIKIAKTGSTIYLANVTFGNDVEIEKPTEVVRNGSGEELAQYTGDNADIGFGAADYVFEQVTTDTWNHRAHIGNDSTADFLVFEFSMTNASNLTVWFTRNGNVTAGYSNIIAQENAGIGANECAARTIYVFDENNVAATSIAANTKYTVWVYLGGADAFHGVAIGNANSTIYYANVRFVSGTGDNILRQGDANALLPVYDSDVDTIGFAPGTFVQKLTGTSDTWIEDIYANRARITASGTQDYIAVDFVLENALSGENLFYLWAASGNGAVSNVGVSSVLKASIVDEKGVVVNSIVAGKKYTLYVYDPDATYLAIGAYCNNTVYFGNVTYGNGEPIIYSQLKNSTGTLATYEGDVTSLGFDEGEYVQQMITEATDNAWDGTRQSLATDILAPVGQYVSIMFSLDVDFTSSEGNLFFAWCRNGETWPTNFYVTLTPSANARILGTNGEVVTDTLKANTVYMLELYADGVDRYQVANINKKAITVSFATKSIKTYSTSIANSPITGSVDNTVTVAYTAEKLGFGRNEVVKQLETETVSNVWGDTQPTSGKTRPAWLIKVASEAGKVAKVRFALSQDFNSTGMLFYVWAYSDNSGTCPANGSITLSGSTAMTASITDESGNAVTSLKAGQVYELSIYCDTAIKYDIGNFVAGGMITYVSSEVTYTDYTA